MNGVKATGFDIYPDPTIDQFHDEVWLSGHKLTGPGLQAQYTTGTIQRRTLWLENGFTEIRAIPNHIYLDISINKGFGGQGIVAVGTALSGNKAFVSTSTDNGANWTDYQHSSTESAELKAVKYASEDVIYAVGSYTTGTVAPLVLKSIDGGTNWVELTVGLSGIGILNDLAVAGNDSVWAVGNDGKIIHSADGGATWSAQTSNNINHLLGVFFLDAQKGWLVGGNGTIMKTTNGGQTWTVSPINSTLHFADIAFVNEDEGVVIAQNGTIFSYIGCSPVTGTLTVDGPTFVCADGEATFTIQIGQQNVTDYIWEYNGATGTLVGGSVTITAPSEGQGSPSLVIYGTNECSNGSQFSYAPVIVGTPAPFTITAPVTTCVGNFVAVSVESTGVPVTWQMPAGWVQNSTFPNNNGGQFTAGESGIISFTRNNGCFSRTETHEVTVLQSAPEPPVLVTGSLYPCYGVQELYAFSFDPTVTSSSVSFSTFGSTWTTQADTDTSRFVTPAGWMYGPFNITATGTNVCGPTSVSIPLTTSSGSLAGYAWFNEEEGVLVAGEYNNISYQWLLEGAPIDGATASTYTPTVSGNYSLQVAFLDFDCGTHESAAQFVQVTITGLADESIQAISIYPNPASTSFMMDGLTSGSTITLLDAMGRNVISTVATSSRTEVSVVGLSAGIYMVQVQEGGNLRTSRLVVNRQ